MQRAQRDGIGERHVRHALVECIARVQVRLDWLELGDGMNKLTKVTSPDQSDSMIEYKKRLIIDASGRDDRDWPLTNVVHASPLAVPADVTDQHRSRCRPVVVEVKHIALMVSDELLAGHVVERVLRAVVAVVMERHEERVVIRRVRHPKAVVDVRERQQAALVAGRLEVSRL